MKLQRHQEFQITELTIGRERSPLLVVDNFIENARQLAESAAGKSFSASSRYYPGIRARAPLQYRQFFLRQLQDLLIEHFRLRASKLAFSMCHYSLVTTPPEQLSPIQRVPHIDSTEPRGLASIHYLFERPFGGTAFYRHRATGYETIDAGRREPYLAQLQRESTAADFPRSGYIDGDNPHFERIAAQDGVFNRVLIYRRNSLHSGSIGSDFVPDADPRTGRLSINSFIDVI